MGTIHPQVLFLSRQDVEALLSLPRMLEVLEEGFRAYSSGRTSTPPRTSARAPSGLLGAMPGWVDGAGLAIKAVTVFPGNAAAAPPSHQAIILLFDDADGRPLCVMDGEYITAIRTAGGAAVSVKLLARSNAHVLAILGAGVQGGAHLQAVPLVRDFTEIRVASRDRSNAQRLAGRDPRCVVADTFEAAVRGADVVCCCTDTRRPVLESVWVGAGTHVTSVGGTFGPEIDAHTVQRTRVFVEWRGAATHPPPAGAHELQERDPETVSEIGEVLLGTRPGRESAEQLTLYKSTGVAFEDVVVARMVYEAAVAQQVGGSLHLT